MGEHKSAKTAHSQIVRLEARASLIDRFIALVMGVSLPPDGENIMAGWCSKAITALAREIIKCRRCQTKASAVEGGRRWRTPTVKHEEDAAALRLGLVLEVVHTPNHARWYTAVEVDELRL